MTFPFASQGLVIEASDQAKPRRPRQYRDVLPLLVQLENLARRRGELLVDATVLVDAPHAALCLCHIWYVKASPVLRHNVHGEGRAACGPSLSNVGLAGDRPASNSLYARS